MKLLKITTLSVLTIATSFLTAPYGSADDDDREEGRYGAYRGGYPTYGAGHYDDRFVPAVAPLRVFIEFDGLRDLRRDQEAFTRGERRRLNREDRARIDRAEARVLSLVGEQVPDSIRFVERPRQADLIIRATPASRRVDFDIVDVDFKRKTKGKRFNRRTYSYDRVEEQATLTFAYDYTVRARGGNRIERTVQSGVSDRFIYARNIEGFGPAAFRGDQITIGRVEELAARDTPEFRRQIVKGLRAAAEAQVAFKIAQIIRHQSDATFAPARFDPAFHEPVYRGPAPRAQWTGREYRNSDVRDAVRVGLAAGIITLLAVDALD